MSYFCQKCKQIGVGFDVLWVKKWKIQTSYTDFFVHFFAICLELVKKIIYPKQVGVTDHPSELNLTKVNTTATIPSFVCTHA